MYFSDCLNFLTPQTTKCTSGTTDESCRWPPSQATRVLSTVSHGTPDTPPWWPLYQMTPPCVYGDQRHSTGAVEDAMGLAHLATPHPPLLMVCTLYNFHTHMHR